MEQKKATFVLLSWIAGIFLLIVTGTASAQDSFRGISWGSEPDAVIKKEGPPEKKIEYSPESDIYTYHDKLGGVPFKVSYVFVDDALVQGQYTHRTHYKNKNAYMYDYMMLRDALTQKYGKPTHERSHWEDESFKHYYHHYGIAVSLGHVKRVVTWHTDNTRITLYLKGEKGDITVGVDYLSLEHRPKLNKAQQARLLKKL